MTSFPIYETLLKTDSLVYFNFDGLVKSRKIPFFVIPRTQQRDFRQAKVGIQCFLKVMTDLDPGLAVIPDPDPGRGDDFLRVHQF